MNINHFLSPLLYILDEIKFTFSVAKPKNGLLISLKLLIINIYLIWILLFHFYEFLMYILF